MGGKRMTIQTIIEEDFLTRAERSLAIPHWMMNCTGAGVIKIRIGDPPKIAPVPKAASVERPHDSHVKLWCRYLKSLKIPETHLRLAAERLAMIIPRVVGAEHPNMSCRNLQFVGQTNDQES
jgi:hypothetical protein